MEVEHWLVVCLEYHLEHFVFPDEVLAVCVGDELLAALFLACVHEASLVILVDLFLFRAEPGSPQKMACVRLGQRAWRAAHRPPERA